MSFLVDANVLSERRKGDHPGSAVDTLMAATALVHGLSLATRNTKDVEWTGVSCLNPFEARASA